jgi:hypothetical protein
VWLEDGSYDEIALVPYNRLLTFPLETYSVQNIIEGMTDEEVGEFFPDYDQVVWMDRDESVQVMMGDGQDEIPRAQESFVDGASNLKVYEASSHLESWFTSSSEDDTGDDDPMEGGLSEEEMHEVLVNHTSAAAVSESSDVQSLSGDDERGGFMDENGTSDVFESPTDLDEWTDLSVPPHHPFEEILRDRMESDLHRDDIEDDYDGDYEGNDVSSVNSASVIGYGRVLASLGGLAGLNLSKATVAATRGHVRDVRKGPGGRRALREKTFDISRDQKASQDQKVELRALQRATKLEEMHTKMGWLPVDVVERTLNNTTQLA